MAIPDDMALQKIPQVSLRRSAFNLSYNHKMTFSPNGLFPMFYLRVLPGDTIECSLNNFIRFNNLMVPVMDTLQVDCYFFFMRDRDIYEKSERVVGARLSKRDNNEYRFPYIMNVCEPLILADSSIVGAGRYKRIDGSNYNNLTSQKIKINQRGVDYEIPFSYPIKDLNNVQSDYTTIRSSKYFGAIMPKAKVGGLLDYLYGVVGDSPKALNAMRAMMYYNVYDKFFRPEQLSDGFVAHDRDVDTVGAGNYVCDKWSYNQETLTKFLCRPGTIYDEDAGKTFGCSMAWSDPLNGNSSYDYIRTYAFTHGGIAPVMRKTDYFVLATLEPQDGEAVGVYTNDDISIPSVVVSDGDLKTTSSTTSYLIGNSDGSITQQGVSTPIKYNSGLKVTSYDANALTISAGTRLTTVEQLRQAFQLQRYMERSNRSGMRFQEIMKGHYATTIMDDKLGEPQLLSIASGKFNNIPVVQTGATQDGGTPQGYLTANGVCSVKGGHFIISSPEHGHILGLMCARATATYQEQYDRGVFEMDKWDLFWPEFVGLGDQPVYNYELFNPCLANKNVLSTSVGHDSDFNKVAPSMNNVWANLFRDALNSQSVNNKIFDKFLKNNANTGVFDVFGYQERYAEYRYKNNSVAGLFRSRADTIASIIPNYKPFTPTGDQQNLLVNNETVLKVPSIDVWSYSLDMDEEFKFEYNDNQDPYRSYGISSVPRLSSDFTIANTPWERSAYYTDIQPLYADIYFNLRAVRPLPVIAVPGLADHY